MTTTTKATAKTTVLQYTSVARASADAVLSLAAQARILAMIQESLATAGTR